MIVMKNAVAAVEELLGKFDKVSAIETGTIRSFDEKHESTKHISRALGDRGRLISVDNSPKSIQISQKICDNAENVTWVLSDSIEYLGNIGSDIVFHFVLLDSVNDGKHIWKEFKNVAPRIVEGGILIVDDAGIKSGGIDKSVPAVKGHKVWTSLKKGGVPVSVLNSPHGTQLRIDFNRKNRNKILRLVK